MSTFPSLASPSLCAAVDKTRTVGSDRGLEDAADALAHEVLASLPPQARPSPFSPEPLAQADVDREAPLAAAVRAWMEPGFGADFSGVRVHTGPLAAELCRALGARAFAYGARVFYGEGLGPGLDAVTAHELAHVVQQRGRPPVVAPVIQLWPWEGDELTPERKKAFDRRDQLPKRISDVADPFKFKWNPVPNEPGKFQLACSGSSPKTRFQKYMKEYVDNKDQVIPIRLVSKDDSICEDAFFTTAVDLDDLAAADDIGFQAIVMHILEERYSSDDYVGDVLDEKKMPKDATKDKRYIKCHTAARVKEAQLFQDIFHDPSIVPPPLSFCPRSGPYVIQYPSKKEDYVIVQRIEAPKAPVAKMTVWVVQAGPKGDLRFTAEEFAEKRAASPPLKSL